MALHAETERTVSTLYRSAGDISRLRLVAFIGLHFLALAAIWTGVTRVSLVMCAALYVLTLLAVTIGHHRYFAHRSFKTSRVMQLILGFWAQTSLQKGVLWWAAHHRYHHRHSDQDDDLHSPKHGILWSYAGWIFSDKTRPTRYELVPDLAKFPELRLLDAFPYTPGVLLAIACYAIEGWPGVVVGFLWANLLAHHATFANNCFAHIYGTRPYATTDGSRNNWFLAAITLGEGWHNNHHRYPGSARNGFVWWEIDVTYYVLRLLEKLGIIWDLRAPPPEVLAERAPSPSPSPSPSTEA
jgi:stearoyl-CoA desaturase (Delta-9 desaturase)